MLIVSDEFIDLEIKDIVAIHHYILAIHIGGMVACDDIQYITNSNIREYDSTIANIQQN